MTKRESRSPNGTAVDGPKSWLGGLPTYPRSQVPAAYREPFIMSGYRKTNISLSECLAYTLVWHNDVCNFWSHFLPLLVWLPWLCLLSLTHHLSQPFYYPLLCFWFGSCAYALFSSIAHLFGAKSHLVRNVCFMADYIGITIIYAGGGLYNLHHQLPLSSSLYDYLFPLVCLHLLACVVAALFGSLSRFFWFRQRFLVRALAFFPAYVICITPFTLRMLSCASTGQDCIWPTIHLHFLSNSLTGIGVFFFVSKIPERLAPGRFDIFPHSHTLFHICAVAFTSIQMYIFPQDSEIRKTQLLEKVSPSFMTLILPFLVMICVGLVQVLFLAFLLMRGVLVPHGVGSTLSSLHGGPHTVDTPSANGDPCYRPPLKKQQ